MAGGESFTCGGGAAITWTYDLATDVGKVRLRVGDTVQTGATWTDEEIDAVLTMEGSVKLAAAALYEMVGDRESLQLAAALREQGVAELSTESFDYAEMVYPPFGRQDRLENEFLRGQA